MSRRKEILEAAYDIVGQEGLEGLHARTVASRIGINHAAVHYYFRTRADLIAELAKYAFDHFFADQERLLDEARTPSERIDALIAQAQTYSEPHSKFIKNWISFFVAGISDDQLRDLLGEHLTRWCEVMRDELSHNRPEVAAASPLNNPRALVATLIGLILVAHIEPDGSVSEELERLSEALTATQQETAS